MSVGEWVTACDSVYDRVVETRSTSAETQRRREMTTCAACRLLPVLCTFVSSCRRRRLCQAEMAMENPALV